MRDSNSVESPARCLEYQSVELGARPSVCSILLGHFPSANCGNGRAPMDSLQKNIAATKGEALAAHLLASAALQAVFAIVADKEQMLKAISAMIDDTLNNSGPALGDGNDEFNTLVREVARNQVDQTLAAIARGPRRRPHG